MFTPTYSAVLGVRACHRIHKWVQRVPNVRALADPRSQHRISTARSEKQRHYSSQGSQSPNVVFSDPHRPSLFYHFMSPPTPLSRTLPAFGLSFLQRTPPTVHSAAVIGWLPAQTYGADEKSSSQSQENKSSLQDFRENPEFITFLHKVIRSGLSEGVDEIWKDAALQLRNGWMHIHDQRNPPDQGRIGDPDDIIGSVLVVDSEIKAETYEPMPSYRVCTSDGVLQLTPGLAQYLDGALVRLLEENGRRP